MKIQRDILKCVAFIGCQKANGEFVPYGTVFFLGVHVKSNLFSGLYAVTAKHVIDKIRSLPVDKVFIRSNFKNAPVQWCGVEGGLDWIYHPEKDNVDVAILPITPSEEHDHLVFPTTKCVSSALEIGLGEEVFITGLFSHRYGEQKNIPIVRVGNVASTVEEKIKTRGFGLMEAYLVEVRSIGGLSGSPVFIHKGMDYYLLGLTHGHYDVDEENIDEMDLGFSKEQGSVNTGIAIVVPVEKILETIWSHMGADKKSQSTSSQ